MNNRKQGARRVTAILGTSALALSATATTALAVQTPEPEYPPVSPTAASGVCVGDIPYFSYESDYGPGTAGRTVTITFVNPNGEDFVYSGVSQGGLVLWPGASQQPPDWPGWVLQDGVWVESTSDPGAYTRVPEGVKVIFALDGGGGNGLMATGLVAPIASLFQDTTVIETTVFYPPASSVCANPQNTDTPPPDEETPPPGEETPPPGEETPPTTTTTTPGLPVTGAQTAALLAAGGGLLAGGTALVVASRRRGAKDSL